MKAVLLYCNTMSYCSPASSVTLVELRCSCSAVHTEGSVGSGSCVIGRGRSDEMMERTAWMASIWVPYAQGPSWSCSWGKSGGGGTCGRRGQRQSLGPVDLRQPSRMTLPSQSNAMTAVLVKSTRQPALTKGASPMRECGKPAMTWPFLLAGGKTVTDASSPLAMECTGVPLAMQTLIVGAVAS